MSLFAYNGYDKKKIIYKGKQMEEEFREAWPKTTEESYQSNLQALRDLPDPTFEPIQLRLNPWAPPIKYINCGRIKWDFFEYCGKRNHPFEPSDYWGPQLGYATTYLLSMSGIRGSDAGKKLREEICDRETGCGGITCNDCDDLNGEEYHG